MKNIIFLLFVSFLTNAQKMKFSLSDFENHKELIYREDFDKKTDFEISSLKISKSSLELTNSIRVSKNLGLQNMDDFDVEAVINTTKLSKGERAGITIGSITNKGSANVFYVPYKALSKNPSQNKTVKMNFVKIDNIIYQFINNEYYRHYDYVFHGGAFGFMSPEAGDKAFVEYFKVSKINRFKSNLVFSQTEQRYSTIKYEDVPEKKLNPLRIYQAVINVKNTGLFDIYDSNIKVVNNGDSNNVKVTIKKKFNSLKSGKEDYIHILFESSKNLKSQTANYSILIENQYLKNDVYSFPIQFETVGYPPSNIEIIKTDFVVNDKPSKITGGAYGSLQFILKNTSPNDASLVEVALNSDNSIFPLPYEFDFSLKPNESGKITIPIYTATNFAGEKIRLSPVINATGMDDKTFKIEMNAQSLSIPKKETFSPDLFSKLYGKTVDYNSIKNSIDAIDNQNIKAFFFKAILQFFGEAGYKFDQQLAIEVARKNQESIYALALKGDIDCQLLLGFAYQYGIGVPVNKSLSQGYFKNASTSNIPVTKYLYALNSYLYDEDIENVKNTFLLVSKEGVTISNYWLGIMNLEGKGFTKNESEAYNYFKKAADFGEPNSKYMLGVMHMEGKGAEVNVSLAEKYLIEAAKDGVSEAMVMLGIFYTKNNIGRPKNIKEAVFWFEKGIAQGNSNAMATYGAYLMSKDLIRMDYVKAEEILLLAAIKRESKVYPLLSKIYTEGILGVISAVKSRYWANEASKAGIEAEKVYGSSLQNYSKNLLSDINWDTAIFGKFMEGTDYSGQKVTVNTGSDFGSQILGGILGSYTASRVPDPNSINKIEVIYETDSKRIIGATLNKYVETSIELKKGQKINFSVTGKVQVGMNAKAGPEGIKGYYQYNLVNSFNHGCLMVGTSSAKWYYVGKGEEVEFKEDGVLILCLNDNDQSNNRGGFDVVFEIDK